MKKRLLAGLLAIAMLIPTMVVSVAAADSTYTDMPDNYATEALEYAVENAWLQGYADLIMPYDCLTRAQMAAILVRAFGEDEMADMLAMEDYSEYLSEYTDVNVDSWYYTELSCAVYMGLFNGYGDGTMRPSDSITRQEAFVVLARAYELEATDLSVLDTFSDSDNISSWAVDDVAALVEAGYVLGTTAGILKPKDCISRQDFAVVLYRIETGYYDTTDDDTSSSSNNPSTTTYTYYDYVVKGSLSGTLIDDLLNTNGFTLNMDSKEYQNIKSTDNGKTISEVAVDVLANNESSLSSYIELALEKKVYDEYTQEVEGYEATLTIDETGLISIEIAASVFEQIQDDITDALSSNPLDGVEAQFDGLSTTFSGYASALDTYFSELVSQATSIATTASELADKAATLKTTIDNNLKDSTVIEGITTVDTLSNYLANVDAVIIAGETLAEDFDALVGEINAFIADVENTPGASSSIDGGTISYTPPTFDLDDIPTDIPELSLTAYYDDADAAYDSGLSTFISKIKDALDITNLSDAQYAAAEALYNACDPSSLISDVGDGTLLMKTSGSEYYAFLSNVVELQCDLWIALADDVTDGTYNSLVTTIGNATGITATVASYDILTATDGYFFSECDEGSNALLVVVADLDTLISKALSLSETASAFSSQIPTLGSFTMTITIEKT